MSTQHSHGACPHNMSMEPDHTTQAPWSLATKCVQITYMKQQLNLSGLVKQGLGTLWQVCDGALPRLLYLYQPPALWSLAEPSWACGLFWMQRGLSKTQPQKFYSCSMQVTWLPLGTAEFGLTHVSELENWDGPRTYRRGCPHP